MGEEPVKTWSDPLDLAEQLSAYASHPIGCSVFGSYVDGYPECSCGLDAARGELAQQRRFAIALKAKMQEPIFLEMRGDLLANYRTPTQIAACCVWAGEPSPGSTIPVIAREPKGLQNHD